MDVVERSGRPVARRSQLWLFWICALGFRLSLELGYFVFVSPRYEYLGFTLALDTVVYVESWLLFLLLMTLMPWRLRRPSDFLISLLVFSFIVPIIIFYGLSAANREHLYIMLLGSLLVQLFRLRKPLSLRSVRGGRSYFLLLCVLCIALVTAWMLASGGLSRFNLDFREVYEYRESAAQSLNRGFMSYLNQWAVKVLGPGLLAWALWKRAYPLAAIMLVLHVVWFGITAHKSVLFSPCIVLFVWWYFRSRDGLFIIPLGMALLSLVVLLNFFATGDALWSSMFIRRVFFVPALNAFAYYEFFNLNSHVYWSNSVMSSFLEYSYSMSPADLIGAYRGTDSHVNNSFLATGYMHAGIAGVVFYGIAVGCLLWLVDSLRGPNTPVWLAIAFVAIPLRSLFVSADLFTTLLTHGFIVSLLILYLFRRSGPAGAALVSRPIAAKELH